MSPPHSVLLLVLPFLVHVESHPVIHLTQTRPDNFDTSQPRTTIVIYCTRKHFMICHTFYDEHGEPDEVTYHFPDGEKTGSSVAVIYEHSPCNVHETPTSAEERAYLLLDTCQGLGSELNIQGNEVESMTNLGDWHYCKDRKCESRTDRTLGRTTWNPPTA